MLLLLLLLLVFLLVLLGFVCLLVDENRAVVKGGGALLIDGARISGSQCSFVSNRAGGSGGSIYATAGSKVAGIYTDVTLAKASFSGLGAAGEKGRVFYFSGNGDARDIKPKIFDSSISVGSVYTCGVAVTVCRDRPCKPGFGCTMPMGSVSCRRCPIEVRPDPTTLAPVSVASVSPGDTPCAFPPPGFEASANRTAFDKCKPHLHSAVGLCLPCPVNSQPDAETSSRCVCKDGTELARNQSKQPPTTYCQPCPKSTAGRQGKCLLCQPPTEPNDISTACYTPISCGAPSSANGMLSGHGRTTAGAKINVLCNAGFFGGGDAQCMVRKDKGNNSIGVWEWSRASKSGLKGGCITCGVHQISNARLDGCICKANYYISKTSRIRSFESNFFVDCVYDREARKTNLQKGYADDMLCELCPEGVACGTAGGEPTVKPEWGGHQQLINHSLSSINFSRFVFRCPAEGGCLGTNFTINPLAAVLCANGSSGPLCTVCESSFVKSDVTTPCEQCPDAPVDLRQLGVLVILAAIFVCLRKFLRPSKMRSFTSKLKIMASTSQILTSFASTYDVSFPELPKTLLGFAQVFSLDVQSIFAVQYWNSVAGEGSFYTTFSANVLILPVILPLLFVIRACVGNKAEDKSTGFAGNTEQKSTVVQVMFTIIFALYPTISKTVFQLYDRHALGPSFNGESSNVRLLSADYTIDCDSREHFGWQMAGLALILVYPIGIPLSFFLMLLRNRHVLEDPYHKNHNKVTLRYAFLAQDFNKKCWYFECVDMLRKLMLSSMLIFFQQGSIAQVGLAIVVSIIFYSLQIHLSPYKVPSNNILKLATDAQVSLTLLMALALKAADGGAQIGMDEEMFESLLVVVMVGVPLPLILYGTFLELRDVYIANKEQRAKEKARLERLKKFQRMGKKAKIIGLLGTDLAAQEPKHERKAANAGSPSPKKRAWKNLKRDVLGAEAFVASEMNNRMHEQFGHKALGEQLLDRLEITVERVAGAAAVSLVADLREELQELYKLKKQLAGRSNDDGNIERHHQAELGDLKEKLERAESHAMKRYKDMVAGIESAYSSWKKDERAASHRQQYDSYKYAATARQKKEAKLYGRVSMEAAEAGRGGMFTRIPPASPAVAAIPSVVPAVHPAAIAGLDVDVELRGAEPPLDAPGPGVSPQHVAADILEAHASGWSSVRKAVDTQRQEQESILSVAAALADAAR